MSRYNYKPRVGIDWNNDGFICRNAKVGDELNLIPHPLSYADVDKETFGAGASYTELGEETDYGLIVYYNVMGTNAFGGFLLGQAAGVVDTIPISPSTVYRATCWVKGISGSYGSVSVLLQANDETFTQMGISSALTLTSSWQKISFSFTSGASSDFIYLFLQKNNNTTNITVAVTGFMLTAGAASVDGFNTGAATDLYENITSDVLAARWETGITDERTRVPSEGVASLEVKNDTRKYSPRVTTSPIYGTLQKQLRVSIEVQYLSTAQYITVWNGYTGDYQMNVGIKNPTVSISCEEGMFAMDASSPAIQVLEDTTATEALQTILSFSAYKSSHTPYGFYLDRSPLDYSWLEGYARDGDYLDIQVPSDPDPINFPLVGDQWLGGTTSPRKMLQDLMQVDQGYIFIQNSGMLRYMDRNEVINTAAAYHVDVDGEVIKAAYGHAEYMVNRVNASYYPSSTEDDVILWTTRQPIQIGRGKTKTIKAEFKYNDKEKMTVTAVNPFSGVATPSVLTAVNAAGTAVTVGVVSAYDLENGTAKIFIKNTTTNTIYVSLVLKGSRQVQVDNEQVEAAAEEIDTTVQTVAINNRLLRDEDMALDLSHYLISAYSAPYDQMKRLTFKPKTAAILSTALVLWPGTVITLSEYTTNINTMRHIVMGSSGEYRPGDDLTIDVYLSRADITNDYIVGTTELDDGGELGY